MYPRQSPSARERVLSFLEGELECRRAVLARHGTGHWWGLSIEVRRREGMTHPVLVIDTRGPAALEGTDTGWRGLLCRAHTWVSTVGP